MHAERQCGEMALAIAEQKLYFAMLMGMAAMLWHYCSEDIPQQDGSHITHHLYLYYAISNDVSNASQAHLYTPRYHVKYYWFNSSHIICI